MPRRGSQFTPPNALSAELIARRGGQTQAEAAIEAGLAQRTWSALERGTHAPSAGTALKLARWLGWTVEQVLVAAEEPAE